MIDRTRLLLPLIGAFAALLLLASCASTTLESTWSDPTYTGGPFKKFFVVGLSAPDTTARRNFEDIMAAKLQAAGVQAVPGYQFIDAGSKADEPSFQAAVLRSGADGLIMSRLLGVDTQTNVSTMMVPGPGLGMGVGIGRGWYGAYSGWYAVPQVTQYQIARVETSVFDVKTERLVWSATSETFNPTTVRQEAPGLADTVIKALQARGLIAGK